MAQDGQSFAKNKQGEKNKEVSSQGRRASIPEASEGGMQAHDAGGRGGGLWVVATSRDTKEAGRQFNVWI